MAFSAVCRRFLHDGVGSDGNRALHRAAWTKASDRWSSRATSKLNLPKGARYALIGPNGAGKTTLINLMTGMLKPNAGQIFLGGEDVTALEPQERVRRGLARTFQINTLFPSLNALEAVTLAVCERRNIAGEFWRNVAVHREAIEEAHDILAKLRFGRQLLSDRRANCRTGRQRLLGDCAGTRPPSQRSCCSTSRRRACRGRKRRSL